MLLLRILGLLLILASLPLLLLAFAPATRRTLPDVALPAAGLAQTPHLTLEYPSRFHWGDTEILTLSLYLDSTESGGLESPPYLDAAVGSDLNAFAGYNMLAVAHLDVVGLHTDPIGDISQPLAGEQTVTWRWQITADGEPGQREVNLIVHLRFIPTSGGEIIERALWARRLEVEATEVLGLSAFAARILGFAGSGVGFILLAIGFTKRIAYPVSRNYTLRDMGYVIRDT